jgi:hypothetical protein
MNLLPLLSPICTSLYPLRSFPSPGNANLGVKAFIHSYIASAQANSSSVLMVTEKAQAQKLADAVGKWKQELEDAREASMEEAAQVQHDLRGVTASEEAHKQALMKRVLALISTAQANKDASDVAIAAMGSGLTELNRKLNETDHIQRQAQLDTSARIRSLIKDGLEGLHHEFASALTQLNISADKAIRSKTSALDAMRGKIRVDMLAREKTIAEQLAEDIAEQRNQTGRHQDQILALKSTQHRLKTRLGGAIALLEAGERLANQKLSLRQSSDRQYVTQELTSLSAKLARAVAALESESLDIGSAQDKSMQDVKSSLGQTQTMLQQMQWALGEQQLSDAAGIRGEVASGVVALKDRLAAAISDSAQKIQAVLNARLQELDSTVTQVCMM